MRDFMNVIEFPFHFSAKFLFRTHIRLQYILEQVRVAVLSTFAQFIDTHFFAFSRSGRAQNQY